MGQTHGILQPRKILVLFSIAFAGVLLAQVVNLVEALGSRDYASVPQYICLSALMLLGIVVQLLSFERHPRLATWLVWVSFALLPVIFLTALLSITWKP